MALALADGALSQPATPAPSGTVLITLGTRGGPLPTHSRTQSSNLLVVNKALYLIDAGDGVTRRIVKSGHDFREVGRVFITHAHSDHTAGLATLLVSQWEYQRREPTVVYGSGAAALVKGAIAYLTPNAEIRWAEGKRTKMADVFRGQDVAPGAVYQDANVRVTAVENTHFNFPPDSPGAGKYRSYSYRFETPGRVVVKVILPHNSNDGDAELEITVPRDSSVEVSAVSADVESIRRRTNGTAWKYVPLSPAG
jgi:hypothetical protein